MQLSLHYTASLATLHVQHLSKVVWLDIPSRFSWYSANYHSAARNTFSTDYTMKRRLTSKFG